MLKLKVQMHSLLQENQSLKDQLSGFQNLHDQVSILYSFIYFMYDYKFKFKLNIVWQFGMNKYQ